jgi:dynamin 1-like protein
LSLGHGLTLYKAMAIVNERHNPPRPVQVDPKTGKPLAATPARAGSPTPGGSADSEQSNTGFFGSFFAAKNKKKAAAMEPPPPTLKASGTLSEREGIEVEVISESAPLPVCPCYRGRRMEN